MHQDGLQAEDYMHLCFCVKTCPSLPLQSKDRDVHGQICFYISVDPLSELLKKMVIIKNDKGNQIWLLHFISLSLLCCVVLLFLPAKPYQTYNKRYMS